MKIKELKKGDFFTLTVIEEPKEVEYMCAVNTINQVRRITAISFPM